jgi:hypothetical protein
MVLQIDNRKIKKKTIKKIELLLVLIVFILAHKAILNLKILQVLFYFSRKN